MSKLIHYSGPAGSILLPHGYTRLAWIESDGTAVIDTGYAPTATTELYFEASGIGGHYIGSRIAFDNSGTLIYSFYAPNANTFRLDWLGLTDAVAINGIVHVLCKPKSVTVNGTVLTRDITKKALSNTMYLFGTNGGGNCFAGTRFYKVTIWSNSSTLVRDFVPVKRTSDNAVGFLDLLHLEAGLYTCSGLTGSVEIPQGFPTSEYCLVEWLGNKKATGYVAIPYTHKADTWVDTEMSFDSFYTWNTMFGACTADNSSDSFTFGCYIEGKINCDLGAAYLVAFDMTAGTFYRFLVSSKTIIKDTTTYSPNKTTTACDKTWALFTRHNNTSYTNEAGHGKFKYMKIYEGTFNSVSGSTLKAHLVPCYRRSDMKPGFYDLVGRSFHEFVGTGASMGPSITFGWGEVMNSGCATGGNLLEGKTNIVGKRCDEETLIPIYASGNNDNATWVRILKVGKGGIFTLSFDAKADVTNNAFCYFYNNTNGLAQATRKKVDGGAWTNTIGDGRHEFSITTSWVRHTITWKFTDTGEDAYKSLTVCRSGSNSTNAGKNIYVRNIKLQYGEVYPGSFTPLNAIPHNISTGDGRNGEKNGAFIFNGLDTYMTCKTPDLASVFNSLNWTVAFWCYPTNLTNTWQIPISYGATNEGNLYLILHVRSNTIMFSTYGTDWSVSPTLVNNTWYHIAYVYRNGLREIWLNGVKLGEKAYSIANIDASDTSILCIGKDYHRNQYPYYGRIYDLQIWNEVKNPAELM